MTVRSLLDTGSAILTRAEVPDAGHDAFLLLAYVSGISHTDVYADPDTPVEEKTAAAYLALCEQRAQRIPLQLLTGEQDFMGLTFHTRPGALIPRWDTEVLAETALAWVRDHRDPQEDLRILDLGCGTGCILISLIHELAGAYPVTGLGVDRSREALALSEENARLHHLEERISWRYSDWFSAVQERDFTVIVSNPPYIARDEIAALEPEVAQHDPREALDGGADGLDAYRLIVPRAKDHLVDGGLLAVETGWDQGPAVRGLFEENGYHEVRIIQDLAGHDRVVIGEL